MARVADQPPALFRIRQGIANFSFPVIASARGKAQTSGVREFAIALCLWLMLPSVAGAHVVTQISAEWKGSEPWELEVLFDAGYAVPELRNDSQAAAPTREWLVAMGEPGWGRLRQEAERYLRECLEIRAGGRAVDWQVGFVDFEKSPPDFPELLNDGAYFRMKVTGTPRGLADPADIVWKQGRRPSFVLKLPGETAGYLVLKSGDTAPLPSAGVAGNGRASSAESFRQGFLHVLPLGLDHVLFVMGLFFYQRKWRPLLAQSLAFTLAHTVTLGLAAAGIVRVPGHWVEPWIALSLVVVALGNLRTSQAAHARPRLALVFGFGLIHGLGFAGALSTWIQPGKGFLTALLSANLGVEAAQATLLAAAWLLTLGWHDRDFYPRFRWVGCLAIAGAGGWLFLERIGG